MLNEKYLADIRERADSAKRAFSEVRKNDVLWEICDSDIPALLSQIEELQSGGTFKLLREAQRKIAEQEKRIATLELQRPVVVQSDAFALALQLSEAKQRIDEQDRQIAELDARVSQFAGWTECFCEEVENCYARETDTTRGARRALEELRGPVADGEG